MMMGLLAAATLAGVTMTAPGPEGPLEGTYLDAGKGTPVVVIIPGSGPTDRDGNNPMGVKAAPYKLLAEALATKGVSTIRIDKRGLFGSKAAIADPNKVRIADYATDAHAWARKARSDLDTECVWIAGHSEGALVALAAGQDPADLCGIIAISGMGRKFGVVLREQLRANPANAALIEPAEKALAELEAGRKVDVSALPPPLLAIFNPVVQDYLIDLAAQDSAALAGKLKLPLLVVHGESDIQTSVTDAKALAAANPDSKLVIVPGVNHVLKSVGGGDRSANLASYADPERPVAPEVVDAIADFVKARR